jgi:hypothetical protein
MALDMNSISGMVRDAYLPIMREQEDRLLRGVLVNLPQLADRVAKMSDGEFLAYFKMVHPLPEDGG